ncbi:hypothetical protein [Chroococcidiopsis sp. CCALA 051]|nr:hypothetical protein [Chroococcidiopsis sp. CCALA 051]
MTSDQLIPNSEFRIPSPLALNLYTIARNGATTVHKLFTFFF